MASSKIKGITVEIGGDTTKLGKAIADVEKQSNSLKGELKQVEKLLKMDPGNADLMAQKQEILTRAVSETTEKLKILREAQEQVERQFKSGDIGEDQYRAFQREIIKTENELKDFENALDGTGDAIEDVGNSAEQSSDGFTIMKGALADLVANAITSAISAIGDFIGSIMELSEVTEEYRQMQAKLSGSAETFGYSVDFANEKYKEFYKYLGDDQASTNAITNLMGIGAETETVSKLADGATAVWASYGDSIPIEGLTEAINETITVGKVTGGMADTINWAKNANEGLNTALSGNKTAQKAFNDALKEGLPVEDAFNEALAKITDEQERADVVAKFLNDTYGESKKTYDEMSGSIMDANEAELELKETQAKLGEAVAPVNTALTDMKNQALQAIAPLVEKLADAFMDLYHWLQENPTAMKIITGVVIALAGAFTILAGALAIQGLITGVTKAIALLNGTLLANPIVLITALIVGLVAGFIYLWNNCDAFREFWINLWEKIKSVASTVKDALVEFFTVTIPNAWATFKEKSSEVINSVVSFFKELPGKIWGAIVGAIERVGNWCNEMKTKAVNGVKNMITSVVNFFTELPNKIGFAIGFVIGKLILWGSNMISWVKTNIPKIINAVVNFFKELPGKIWKFLVDIVKKIGTWCADMKTKATNGVKSLISSVVSFMRELPSKIWSAIVGAVNRVATWGSQMKTKAVSAIKNMVSNVVSTAKSLPSKIWSAISGAIGKMASWGSQMLSKAKTGITNVANAITNGLKSVPSKMASIGKNIVEGVWNGIKNATSWITNKVKSFAKSILNGIKSALGIKSPSRVFRDEVGKYIAEGIGVGITDNSDSPINALEELGDDMANQELAINGATINRQLNTTFKNDLDNVLNSTQLMDKLDSIAEKLGRLQIVLDTGTLVGETVDAYDQAFANRKTQLARGW